MRTVNQVSKLTGISVRALHHYDAIGLLKPTEITESGYRLYDDDAICRLQSILFFRELQFPLKDIKAILDSPDYHPAEALNQQIKLLELQYKRLGELILYAKKIKTNAATLCEPAYLMKGEFKMNFKVFDQSEMEQYKEEVKERWGKTKAYQEYLQKEKKSPDFTALANQLMSLFAEIGTLRQLPPSDEKVQKKISALQNFITENYYTCTDEILDGLGQMYAGDERFRKNIDKAGGDGTAEFVMNAIKIHCSGK